MTVLSITTHICKNNVVCSCLSVVYVQPYESDDEEKHIVIEAYDDDDDGTYLVVMISTCGPRIDTSVCVTLRRASNKQRNGSYCFLQQLSTLYSFNCVSSHAKCVSLQKLTLTR